MCVGGRELFVDGYDAEGNRVYDKVNGETCHQCRQKTVCKHTHCSQCSSLRVRSCFAQPALCVNGTAYVFACTCEIVGACLYVHELIRPCVCTPAIS